MSRSWRAPLEDYEIAIRLDAIRCADGASHPCATDHLGLSRYLQAEWDHALEAYRAIPKSGPYANDESLAATAHWQYMALRRSGATAAAAANASLDLVRPGMRTLDGGAYLQLCLWYKGLMPEPELNNASALDLATLGYGVGNYHFYNGRQDAAIAMWRRVVNTSYWAAFGYIAAEAELFRLGLGPEGVGTRAPRGAARGVMGNGGGSGGRSTMV